MSLPSPVRTSPVIQAAATSLTETSVPVPPPSTTPLILRRWRWATVIALFVLGAVCTAQLLDFRAQLASAPQLGDQYSRLATVEADLIEAQTLARLGGAANDAAAQHVAAATSGLVAAAAQRPNDQDALAALTQSAVNYGSLLAAPTPAHLDQAETILTKTLSPGLAQLRASLSSEALQSPWSANVWLLWLVGAVVAAALGAASVGLARHSHRVVNFGLALAALAGVIVMSLGLAGLGQASDANRVSRGTAFSQITHVANARLTLADLRHSLAASVSNRSASQDVIAEQRSMLGKLSNATDVPDAVSAVVAHYRDADTAVAKQAWDQLRQLLIAKDTASAEATFSQQLDDTVEQAVSTATAESVKATNSVLGEAILALVFALVGAGAAYWGVSLRLREYR